MLMASHLAGIGQASGTGVGLVHALGHAIGTRGRLAHGTALAAVLPEVLAFYAEEPGLRDRELTLVGVALAAASPTETRRDRRGRGHRRVADASCAELGQRPRLRSLGFDEAALDMVAQRRHRRPGDPQLAAARRPLEQARAILGSVLD